MNIVILPATFAVCRLSPGESAPQWIWADRTFLSMTYTVDEYTVVCPDAQVPAGVRCERGWRVMKVQGPLDFSLTGILASLTAPLANAGIPIFAISTFDTDYLLVKEEFLIRARAALEKGGHVFMETAG